MSSAVNCDFTLMQFNQFNNPKSQFLFEAKFADQQVAGARVERVQPELY